MERLQIGDYVKNQWGEEGSIIEEYPSFWQTPEPLSMTRREWLDRQLVPFKESELNERWFSVHCQTGGSIRSCESKLTIIHRPEINL